MQFLQAAPSPQNFVASGVRMDSFHTLPPYAISRQLGQKPTPSQISSHRSSPLGSTWLPRHHHLQPQPAPPSSTPPAPATGRRAPATPGSQPLSPPLRPEFSGSSTATAPSCRLRRRSNRRWTSTPPRPTRMAVPLPQRPPAPTGTRSSPSPARTAHRTPAGTSPLTTSRREAVAAAAAFYPPKSSPAGATPSVETPMWAPAGNSPPPSKVHLAGTPTRYPCTQAHPAKNFQ